MMEIGKLQRKYKNEKEKKVGFVLCVMVVQKCMGSLKSERGDTPSNFHLFIYGFVLLFPLPCGPCMNFHANHLSRLFFKIH